MTKKTCQCGYTTTKFLRLTDDNFPSGYVAECCKAVEAAKRKLELQKEKCKVGTNVNKTLHYEALKQWVSSLRPSGRWTTASDAFLAFQDWRSSSVEVQPTFTQARFGRYMKEVCAHKRSSRGVLYLLKLKENLKQVENIEMT